MKQFNNIQDPIARAEAMRAQAISELVIDAIEGLRDLFQSAKGKFQGAKSRLVAYLEYRRTYAALSAMTDRELDDIGIGRSDIEAVARGFDPRKVRAETSKGDALAQHLALAKVFDKEVEARKPAVQADDHRTAAAA